MNFRFKFPISLYTFSYRQSADVFEKESRRHTVVAGDGRSKIMLRSAKVRIVSERVRSYQRLSRTSPKPLNSSL
jgi:hypothetical protein